MLELFLVATAVTCILYLWRRNPSSANGKVYPPGPEPSLIVGNFKDIDTDRVHQSLHELAGKYGPIVQIRLLKRKIVILNSSELINKAFATDEYRDLLNDKPTGFYGTYLVFGHADVLLGPYSSQTFRIKEVMYKGLQPSMTSEKLAAECQWLVNKLAARGGTDFDPSVDLEAMFAEVTSKLISGEVKDGDVELMWDFVHWSNKLLNPSVESLLKNFPFLRHLPVKAGSLYQTVKAKRDTLLKRYIDDTRKTYTAGVNRGMVDTCFYIQDTEKGPNAQSWLSDDMVKATVIDTIGAGLVSTTNSVLATILNLLHNRPCVEKMLKEINEVLGADGTVTGSHLARMPYCHAAVLETLRLSCVVPIVSHYWLE